jgi:two-component system, OmpR family, alkaline phosphatase synthesis response regulator PhoP
MNKSAFKIMIVEDDMILLRSLAFTLRRFEYQVSLASNGMDALAELVSAQQSAQPFDLLITDIQLPGIAGLDLIDKLHDQSIVLPTLAITGSYGKNLVRQLEKRGVCEFLTKPFNSIELVKRVSVLLKDKTTTK